MSMRFNGLRRASLIVSALALTGAMVSGTPASAAPVASGEVVVAACTVTAGAPFKSGSSARANYLSSGCVSGWYIRFYLQRSRAWGWGWETLDSVANSGNSSGALAYNRSGDGTYTYRNYREATNPAGVTFTAASSSVRFSC